jgi:RHS repeat-associated protein
MSRRLQGALFLLIAIQAGRLLAQDVVAPGTYRVQLIAQPGQDISAVAKAVAAAYGGRLEGPVGADSTVAMSLDGSVLELVGRDARVQRIDAVDELRPAIPQPAVQNRANPAVPASRRLQTDGTITTPWTTGTYAYDAAGNITEIGTERFTYDVYSRIKSGTAAGQSQEYSYDRWGNLTSIKTGVTTIPLTVDTATNRLTSVNGSSMTYDTAGQVLQVQSAGSYTYDGIGMMTSSGTLGIPSNLYLYTASDERIASVFVSGGAEVSSAWTFRDASGKMLRRFDKQNVSGQWNWVWREDYIYNGSQMLASENDSAPKTRHFFADHLGTPRLIVDNGGMQIGLAAYLPFGAQASAAGLIDAKKFTGHERDPSGLDYMHARYYNVGWGRFLSVDAAQTSAVPKVPQTWNRYVYARNNPILRIDPDGRADLRSTDDVQITESRAGLAVAAFMNRQQAVEYSSTIVVASDREGDRSYQVGAVLPPPSLKGVTAVATVHNHVPAGEYIVPGTTPGTARTYSPINPNEPSAADKQAVDSTGVVGYVVVPSTSSLVKVTPDCKTEVILSDKDYQKWIERANATEKEKQ